MLKILPRWFLATFNMEKWIWNKNFRIFKENCTKSGNFVAEGLRRFVLQYSGEARYLENLLGFWKPMNITFPSSLFSVESINGLTSYWVRKLTGQVLNELKKNLSRPISDRVTRQSVDGFDWKLASWKCNFIGFQNPSIVYKYLTPQWYCKTKHLTPIAKRLQHFVQFSFQIQKVFTQKSRVSNDLTITVPLQHRQGHELARPRNEKSRDRQV